MTAEKKTKTWYLNQIDNRRKRARRRQGLDGGKPEKDASWRWYWAGREFAYEEIMRLLAPKSTGRRLHVTR